MRKFLISAAAIVSFTAASAARANDAESAPGPVLARAVQCTAQDSAGQQFKATKNKKRAAQAAALQACQAAGGQNCQIVTCIDVNSSDLFDDQGDDEDGSGSDAL